MCGGVKYVLGLVVVGQPCFSKQADRANHGSKRANAGTCQNINLSKVHRPLIDGRGGAAESRGLAFTVATVFATLRRPSNVFWAVARRIGHVVRAVAWLALRHGSSAGVVGWEFTILQLTRTAAFFTNRR
jgi:hypothetical protein